MRVPRPELRKCLLPESVLAQAIPPSAAYGVVVAEFYGHDPEDLQEAAGIGAWVAWMTYDPAAGASWSTWLRRNVNWYLAEALRDWGRKRHRDVQAFEERFRVLSLNQRLLSADGEECDLALEEVTADPRGDFVAELCQRSEIADLLSQMLPRERCIFQRRYLEARLKEDVAHSLSISKTRVTQIEGAGRARAQDYFAKLEAAARPLRVPEPAF